MFAGTETKFGVKLSNPTRKNPCSFIGAFVHSVRFSNEVNGSIMPYRSVSFMLFARR